MFKRFALLACSVCVFAILSSCGAGDIGGGIGEFTTVNASAQASNGSIESDILTGNSCSDTVSTGGSAQTDSVDVNFTSKAMYSTGALDLVISNVTVEYYPTKTGTPNIQRVSTPWHQVVSPGATDPVTVQLLTAMQKDYLMNPQPPQTPMPLCTGTANIFEYNVKIIFEVSEPGGNGDKQYIPAWVTLSVYDKI
ncbi:MAG: hypothetical protein FPO08_15285 [Geobacter sp.]|nr:MAG: hypothetical protein FPO08_15285 [Geobacter sp.]